MASPLIPANGHPPELLARLNNLRSHLARHIQGQGHVLDRVCSVLVRGELGLAHPRRPRGSFLFVGPTGVGKTETTNIFTAYLFGATPLRFDMSEYQLQKSVDRLLGENGSDAGLLSRALRDRVCGTLLFDEVEKAHPLVLDLFLQILEDARVTLATGETLDLSGFYVVCTSNLGSSETMRMESAPFASVERTVLMRVREHLRPELVGRVDEIVVFSRLDYATQRVICEAMVAGECARLAALGHRIEPTPSAMEFIVRQGYHRMLGARPMRGTVERHIHEAVTAQLLAGRTGQGRLALDAKAERLILSEAG
jgi:ATP-dependent Clp protease ATP-binding subunit ClpB